MTFGEKFQNLRKQKNMSQEDLAERLSVSRQAVSKWELDQSLPDTTNIIAISKIFSVSTDYLLLDDTASSNVKRTSPKKVNNFISLLAGIISFFVGFLGNFTLYFVSRFIKVPITVTRTEHYGTFAIYVRDFFKFISHFDLEIISFFFLILMLCGLSVIIFLYRTQIKSFTLKIITKLKSLKKTNPHVEKNDIA